MASSEIDITSDEIINIKCCLCLEDNRIREAEKYCVQCKNYYCTPCTGTHKKFPTMKDHKLLGKADFRSLGPDGSLPSFPTQRCSQHPTEVIKLYCKQHDEVACVSCVAGAHRSCSKNIRSIPKMVDKLYDKTQFASTNRKIHKSNTSLQEIKTLKEQKLEEIRKDYRREVESLTSFRKELQSQLEKIEHETLLKLGMEFRRIESCLTREIDEVDNLIKAINEAALQLKKSEGNLAQEFISIKNSEKVTTNADKVEKEQQRKIQKTVIFTADLSIKTFIHQLDALGKVSSFQPGVIKQKDSLYKVKQHQIDVKLANDDSNCHILGSCITENGFLLLADSINESLKQIDMSTMTIKDSTHVLYQPTAVCQISKTEAAVAMYNNTVQFVSLENKLSTLDILTLDHHCWGLASKGTKLFITDGRGTLYIHHMNGEMLHAISTDDCGEHIFDETVHIAVSGSGEKLFVADRKMGLVVLDLPGIYLTTVKYPPTVLGIEGVCTDGRNLFVCGYHSNNIVQIGPGFLNMLGELGKIYKPRSLCFDPRRNRLIVTSFDSNTITVLELE